MPFRYCVFLLMLMCHGSVYGQSPYRDFDSSLMPHGNTFESWERETEPNRTFFVDQNHPKASDDNPGTEARPWRSIGKAAAVLQPGERVLIKSGTYREAVHPARGGTGPEQLITYAAAPGHKVVVSGARELSPEGWKPGQGWRYTGPRHTYEDTEKPPLQIWQYDLPPEWFMGYNPFALRNLGQDLEWVDYKNINMHAHFQRRGRLFLDGQLLKQADHPVDLAEAEQGAYWIEHNGLRLHVRFPGRTSPADYTSIEATVQEQVFTPKTYGLPYIRLQGLTFEKAGNGFAMPQRGMVSARRGNHWIIEDCTLEWANSIALDLGNEMWHTHSQPGLGEHIVRGNTFRHCGTGGLQANGARQLLVEDNLFEYIGWHDAEHGWESGAIKFHRARGTLIRRNVFRHITYAPGIWLDYLSSENCRVTQNVFSDITTARGAIYVEVSRGAIHVDHNVFHQLRSQYWISGDYGAGGNAFYTDGSDSIHFHHNLAIDIENTGYGSYLNPARIVAGRGGTARAQSVTDNIFIDCRKHAIELPNVHNHTDGNRFAQMPSGFLKLTNPPPALLLDLKAWQEYFGWEAQGKRVKAHAVLHTDELRLRWENISAIDRDAGPFSLRNGIREMDIDPRE